MTQATSEIARDPLTERIERLLLRHEESRRTVALLQQQVMDLTAERDRLQQRLHAASVRMTAVLARLPPAPEDENTL
jgi:cell division protein ZapB